MKIKICGMKMPENIRAINNLDPDYMGFIFYAPSPRYVLGEMSPKEGYQLSGKTKGVGVFVDEQIGKVQTLLQEFNLNYVQLHGSESPEYCQELKTARFTIIKAFRVNENFDFTLLEPYLSVCDYFLFDTKGKTHGGTGKQFDWSILEKYSLQKPFFLSGGIGPEDSEKITRLKHPQLYALDLNSRFEIKPGLKDTNSLKEFLKDITYELRA